MKSKPLAGNGEPGGARSRGYHPKHATYSFCDVRQSLELLILQDSRALPYTYGTRSLRWGRVCKTFIRRFDSDPRLQFPGDPSPNNLNCLDPKCVDRPGGRDLRVVALSSGTSAGSPGPNPDGIRRERDSLSPAPRTPSNLLTSIRTEGAQEAPGDQGTHAQHARRAA